MIADIRIINGAINMSDYVGIKNKINDIEIEVFYYSSKYDELSISIDGNKNGLYKNTEIISLGLGVDSFVERMKICYGIESNFINGTLMSANSINMMDNMIKIGCSDIVEKDGIICATDESETFVVPCQFLEESEKSFILSEIMNQPKSRSLQAENTKKIKISSLTK